MKNNPLLITALPKYARRCAVALCFLLLQLYLPWGEKAVAQSFSVKPTSVDVSTDEQFQITYSLQNVGMRDFQGPNLDDFFVVGGPNKSQSMQIINGSMSSSVSISYVLQPKKSGNFTIPPATVITDRRKTLRSEQVSVSVSKGRPQPKATPPPASGRQGNNPASGNEKIWVAAIPDTSAVCVGQQITVIYRLYTNVDVANYGIQTPPSFTGFWVEDITPTYQQTPGTTTWNNQQYRTLDLKKYALFPQRPGTLQIDPMEVQVIIRVPDPNAGGGFWGNMFYTNQTLNLTTDPIKIAVADLPQQGKPDNFTGAVGQYEINTVLGNPNVETNESIDLKVTISGTGNMKLIDLPQPGFPPSFEVYEPEVNEETFTQQDKVKGRKTYDFTLIPSEAGQQQLPSIGFSFYNPETRSYQTVTTPPIPVNIRQGKTPAKTGANAEKPGTLMPLNPSLRLFTTNSRFFGSVAYYALSGLPVLLFLGAAIRIRRRKQELSHPFALRQKQAQKVAIQRLAGAQTHLQQNNKRAFYDEVIRAVWGYLSDRVHIPASQLDKDNIAAILQQNGATQAAIEQLLQIITHCEIALFAPAAEAGTMSSTYENAKNAIARTEEDLNAAQLTKP
ncbi:protein BatD [Sphingobacteriales bacterium UPWRP_1]|nr:hypothetical protein BVG80_09395 [Sphingobacteriales bacterium TSM_CSM]PSJ78566.1 protein BatD [Sphingobacteriales bacterium UPWRP_1]